MEDYLIDVIEKANHEVMKVYEKGNINIWNKDDNSPLTEADLNSSKIICSMLEKFNFPIICEETINDNYEIRKNWNKVWLVDPLDGTKEFIARNGEFTTNIALIENGYPIIGFIGIPCQNCVYYAIDGKLYHYDYLTKMKREIIKGGGDDKVLRILASRSHFNEDTQNYINKISIGKEIKLLNVGSSIKFIWMAEGKADVYVRLAPCMEWDTAAGQALVEAMGLRVLIWGTEERMSYNRENLLNPYFLVI